MLKNLLLITIVFASLCIKAGTLSNGAVKLTYSDRDGSTLFIDSKVLSKPLNVIQAFMVYAQAEGAKTGKWITFSKFKLQNLKKDESGEIKKLRCEYLSTVEDGTIKIVTTISLSDTKILSEISVENNTKTPILKVRYPILQRLQFTKDGKEDQLLWPYLTTMLVKDPRNNLLPPKIYPGHAGINLMDLSGNGSGIAIIGQRKLLASQYWYSKSASGNGIMMGIDTLNNIKPGAKANYNCTIYVHKGNWKVAGEYYREWFYKNFPKPKYPDWAKYSNGYLGILWSGGEYPNYDVRVENHINATWRLGLSHLQYWGQTGKHACPGYPLADPMRGGEKNLAKMFSKVIDSGLYTGAYFWSCGIGKYEVLSSKFRGKKWTDYPKELRPPSWEWVKKNSKYKASRKAPTKDLSKSPGWKRWKVKSLADAEARNLNPQALHNLVFHSVDYRKWLNFWIRRYEDKYKIQVPYLDVYGFRPAGVEYNPHLKMWGDGTEGIYRYQFLKNLNKNFKNKIKGFTPMIEGVSDCYNTQAPALISGFRRFIEGYRYIFPELILHYGMHNGNWWSDKALTAISDAYLDGNRFDLIWKWISQDISRITWLRDSLMPIVADAKYLLDGGIKVSNDKIQVSFMDAVNKHGLGLINIRNFKKVKDAKITLPQNITAKFKKAFILPLYGDFKAIDLSGDIQVPAQTVTSVLLVSADIEVSMSGIGFVFPEQTPDGMQYDVRTLNFTKKSLPVKIKLTDAKSKVVQLTNDFDIPAYGIDKRTVKLKDNKEIKLVRRLNFVFDANGKQLSKLRRTYEPFFANSDFELNTGLPISNKTALNGKSSLEVTPLKRVQPFISIAPVRKVTISVYSKTEGKGKAEALIYNHRHRKTLGRLKVVPGKTKDGWQLMRCTFKNTDDSMVQMSFNNLSNKGNIYFDQVEVIQH